MRLLVDEMWPAWIAERVRSRLGVGEAVVVAVLERDDLRGRPDADVFAVAQDEGRAVVTENARDFRPLAARWQASGRVHAGLVLTSDRHWPRAREGTAGRLVTALVGLLGDDPDRSDEPSNREVWL